MDHKSLIEHIKPQILAICGFVLPYFTIIVIVFVVIILPYNTVEEKWAHIGGIALWIPLASVIIGAMLVGFYSLGRNRKRTPMENPIKVFTFSFLWSAIFQFIFAIYFFMQIIYMYAGAKH